jgi:hypothetical protein
VRRRAVLGAAAAAVLAGCTGRRTGQGTGQGTDPPGDAPSATGSMPGSGATTATTEPTPTATSTLAAAPAWAAGPEEPFPQIKQAATAFLESAATWSAAGEGSPEGVVERLVAAGVRADVAATAAVLAAPDAEGSTLEVVYPQSGGQTPTDASVMTAVRQTLQRGGVVEERSLTLDVRVRLVGAGWTALGVVPLPPLAGPGTLGPQATAVLANPRIRLPGAAEADLRSGSLDETMLGILNGIGQHHDLDVAVFYDGHPPHVFATDRVSNHHVGRAVDIWAVDGRTVASLRRDRAVLDPILVLAARLGATEIGSPYDRNGPKGGYFTDAAHQDHLHIGVSANRPAVVP